MKRTYQGYAGGAAPAPSATPTPTPAANPVYPYQPAQASPYPGQPPLPTGAAPPQPYQQQPDQQQQQHQYAGYGYAGQPAPAPHQQTQHGYNNYFAPQPAAPAPAAPPTTAATQQQYSAYGYGGTQGQQHVQAGQYANYGYGAEPQPKASSAFVGRGCELTRRTQPYANYQQVYQPQPGPAYAPQAYSHPPYTPGQPAVPPAPVPGGPQAYPYAGAPPPNIGAPIQPAPTGAPPYKRPRYEGAPAPPYQPQPLPPALPPLANPAVAGRGGPAIRGGRGGVANVGRGRGGHHNGIGPGGGEAWEEGYAGAYGDYDGSTQRGGGPFRGGRGAPRADFARGGGPVFAGPMRGGPVPGRGGRGAMAGDRFPATSPKGPRGGVPSGPGAPRSMSGPGPRSSPGGWTNRGGRGQKAGARGRYDDRARGILSPRNGGKTRTWGKDSNDHGDKDRREETSKRTLTDFRINALDVADLSWGWTAETQPADGGGDSLEGVLSAAAGDPKRPPVPSTPTPTPTPAAEGEKKGKHGRDEEEDEDAEDDGTGKKKVKSEAAAEEARKVDEAAQTAPGTGEEKTEREKTEESKEEEHARNADAAAKAVKELKVEDDPEDEPTASTSKDANVDPVDEAIKRAEALDAAAPAAPVTQDAKPHSYSNPTIPAGRENSRLRIYFASPSATAVLDDGTDAHGHSRPLGSKRKLSVGAQSAMSVDAKPLSSPQRGTTPMSRIKPVIEEESALDGAPMTSEGSKDSESSTAAKGEERGSDAKTNGTYPPEPYPAAAGEPKEAAEGRQEEPAEEDGDEDEDAEPPMPEPSPDRISISYARNTRRLVVDSDVVEGIKVFRAEHKIEVVLKLAPAVVASGKFAGEPDEYRVCKGVLIESLDPEADDYVIIDRATLEASWQLEGQPESTESSDDTPKHDPLLPPLHRLFTSPTEGESGVSVSPGFAKGTILIVAKLDTANPLTEAKWVRTGDVDSWISQMTGRVFDDGCGWRQKITVADPDPPPTIQHMLDTWLTTSNVGTIDTRQRFLDRHMSKDADNIIEILLRIVRGSSSSHHPSSTQSLISHQAATLRAPYPEQQTQVSLAVLALYRLAVDTAVEGGSVTKEAVIKKATDIVRSLPYRLAFGALDGIFKDEQA